MKVGIIDQVAELLAHATRGETERGVPLLLFGSAVLSGIIDNIPSVTTMSPVVAAVTVTLSLPCLFLRYL